MKPEQVTSLVDIQERMVEIFKDEVQDDKWPGMETKENRGDRVWYKKNAFASLQIAGKIQSILAMEAHLRNLKPGEEEADLDEENEREAREAEDEARKVLKRYGLKS